MSDEESLDNIKTVTVDLLAKHTYTNIEKMTIPMKTTPSQLQTLVRQVLGIPELDISFFINGLEIKTAVGQFLRTHKLSPEEIQKINFEEKESLTVQAVTRCSSALNGHSASILVVKFSPDSKLLATGSGDKTARLWDLSTEMPRFELQGHKSWVQALEWAPDSRHLATGCFGGLLMVWDSQDGSLKKQISGHRKGITDLSWEPYHLNDSCDRFASCSSDCSIKIWSVTSGHSVLSFNGHTAPVTSIIWGGKGFLYSASRDTNIRIWNLETGRLHKVLAGHAHWVNHISLSTNYALRTSFYDPKYPKSSSDKNISKEDALSRSKAKYKKLLLENGGKELLVSGSDDNTVILWDPLESGAILQRLPGHTSPVSFVKFSPNGRKFVSVSFDKTAKLWNSSPKHFQETFKGHIGSIYQVCWSADSKYFVTGSRDSTLKVWGMESKKCKKNLPGHEDEVYAVDWSPDGEMVASGSKDTYLRIWRR